MVNFQLLLENKHTSIFQGETNSVISYVYVNFTLFYSKWSNLTELEGSTTSIFRSPPYIKRGARYRAAIVNGWSCSTAVSFDCESGQVEG